VRLSRVFLNTPLVLNSSIPLPKETAHYLGNVLRLRLGDELLVFNSTQGEFRARISAIAKREAEIELLDKQRSLDDAAFQPRLSIHLLLGISRGDRMDFAVQKSTELGVSEITPIYTEFSDVKLKSERVDKKLQHWQKIAISASEQSGRLDVPTLHRPTALQELSLPGGNNRWMLEPSGTAPLPDSIAINNIDLLIGPEGGFSTAEIEWAQKNIFEIVSLGSRILRTETAPVAALAIIQNRFGDM